MLGEVFVLDCLGGMLVGDWMKGLDASAHKRVVELVESVMFVRFAELMYAAKQIADASHLGFQDLSVYCCEHDSDLIVRV